MPTLLAMDTSTDTTDAIRITVTDSQGVLLDMVTITKAALSAARRNPVAAWALLDMLEVGA